MTKGVIEERVRDGRRRRLAGVTLVMMTFCISNGRPSFRRALGPLCRCRP